jgi:hypothetical protein
MWIIHIICFYILFIILAAIYVAALVVCITLNAPMFVILLVTLAGFPLVIITGIIKNFHV